MGLMGFMGFKSLGFRVQGLGLLWASGLYGALFGVVVGFMEGSWGLLLWFGVYGVFSSKGFRDFRSDLEVCQVLKPPSAQHGHRRTSPSDRSLRLL